MLLKGCTQYVTKFGKLSSGHRTGRSLFLFHSQRREIPKNAQITVQLPSFHILAKLCSKSFNLYFRSKWTKNFHMYKVDLGKVEEPEIKLPTFIGSKRKQGNLNIYVYFWLYFIDYSKAFDCVDHNKLWKVLKEMGIPDYLTHLLRILYAGQEATVRTGHGTMNWFKIEKGVHQGYILSSCLFNFFPEYIMWNARQNESQAGIKTVRRNINNLRCADDTTLMAES